MPRTSTSILTTLIALAFAAPISSANPRCDARMTQPLPSVERGAQQTLVVESFGACSDPLLLIWIDRPVGRVQHVHFARLSAYERRAHTPATVTAALTGIIARIEPRKASDIESWAKLHADDAPDGASWSGTSLPKADYERIRSSAKHVMLIPTDTSRAKLVAWDGTAEQWIDVVYYGD